LLGVRAMGLLLATAIPHLRLVESGTSSRCSNEPSVSFREQMRVRCTRLSSVCEDDLPFEVEGRFVAFTHDDLFLVEDDTRRRYRIDPSSYDVAVVAG